MSRNGGFCWRVGVALENKFPNPRLWIGWPISPGLRWFVVQRYHRSRESLKHFTEHVSFGSCVLFCSCGSITTENVIHKLLCRFRTGLVWNKFLKMCDVMCKISSMGFNNGSGPMPHWGLWGIMMRWWFNDGVVSSKTSSQPMKRLHYNYCDSIKPALASHPASQPFQDCLFEKRLAPTVMSTFFFLFLHIL